MEFLLIPLMGMIARIAGGGGPAKHLPRWLTWLPEVIFTSIVAYIVFLVNGPWMAALGILTYLGFQAGHGIAYHMGRNPKSAQGKRKQTLSYIIDPICKLFKLTLGERPYCYLFMGLKGLIMGLAMYPWGLLLAILWPLAYDIGRIRNNETAETFSGALVGVVLWLLLAF